MFKGRGRLRNRRLILTDTLLKRQSKARLALVERWLAELDAEIAHRIAKDKSAALKRNILGSIPGIGPIAAAAILTFMPEIGTLGRKQAGCLAALVPHTRESGQWKGKAFIGGGRLWAKDPLAHDRYLVKFATEPPELPAVSRPRSMIDRSAELVRSSDQRIRR